MPRIDCIVNAEKSSRPDKSCKGLRPDRAQAANRTDKIKRNVSRLSGLCDLPDSSRQNAGWANNHSLLAENLFVISEAHSSWFLNHLREASHMLLLDRGKDKEIP